MAPRFHPLTVIDIRPETRDAVVVTLRPPADAAETFAFTQGQYLTFRRDFDGTEVRRSYSICAGLDDGVLQVGIKRVDGGAFSTFANEDLRVGDTLEAMPPNGTFHAPLDPAQGRTYAGFAGGSGITPVLSIIKTILRREPHSTFTLVYANRQISSIMFREALDDLKDQYLDRFSIIHVLESEGQEIDLFTGRIDAAKMDGLLRTWIDAGSLDLAFICGPEPMMLTIAESLRKHGLLDDQIKFELFASGQPGRVKTQRRSVAGGAMAEMVDITVTLDGTTRQFRMPRDGTAILDAALQQNLDVPFACKAGVCSTCRARVTEGEVEMEINHALEDYELRAGYVLSCQCVPVSDRVVLTYDQ